MESKQLNWWEKNKGRLIIIGAFVVCLLITTIIFLGYTFNWSWTGFSTSVTPATTSGIRYYQPSKTLWDWLQLLIFPVALAIIGLLISNAQSRKMRSEEVAKIEETIANTPVTNIQQIAASQLAISTRYYENALQQSRRSFQSALFWAFIGTSIIIGSVIYLILKRPTDFSAYGSLIGGTVVETIAGLNFYLYGRATDQLTNFQAPLDRIGRFLIANSICENLDKEAMNKTRAELVKTIANVPLISPNQEKPETEPLVRAQRPLRNNR